ncbi:EamA family transporter [Nocardia sp. SYP-A9097]|uniref:DMT family transporter n=1 Tax=Nocardia sp. SYP-A9097 TaxID=2663237 RepID=UPI00129AB9C3|nr:DMT family transporter [Nocardia sp. SYP-A9097]MRH90526.1 EamA family transporter [Nocardia sp. SYP-A9097]
MAVGALGIATSGVFIALAGVSPATATFFRCALALPILWPLARMERRREGPPHRRHGMVATLAGVLFAADALLWTQAVFEVGAGLTAVLVNAQVVIVPVLALLIDREPISRTYRLMLPLMVGGILLTAGVFESVPTGTDPLRGAVHALLAALCYAVFLFLLRRTAHAGPPVQSYFVICVSAATVAALWRGMVFAPGWPALGWLALTAACGQLIGWLAVALAAPALSSTVSAAILMLVPVGALALAALILGENPTGLQLFGCALMLAGAYTAATRGYRDQSAG